MLQEKEDKKRSGYKATKTQKTSARINAPEMLAVSCIPGFSPQPAKQNQRKNNNKQARPSKMNLVNDHFSILQPKSTKERTPHKI